MAKIKVTSLAQVRQKIQNEWKVGAGLTDELVYDENVDGLEIQLWAFKQHGVLVDIKSEIGPFQKVVFVAALS